MSGFSIPHTDWSNTSPSERDSNVGELIKAAQLSTDAPRIPWNDFLKNHFQWRQGEHVALVGPTGQGKTTLLKHLLPLHKYTVVFATKPRDSSMTNLIKSQGYHPLERWQSLDPKRFPKRILWPDATSLNADEEQRKVFYDAMAKMYREGGWTIVVDELWYLINVLGLEKPIRIFLLQSRALDESLVVATQRPAFVPLEVYDQSTHLFFWRDNDERNLSRLSGISWRSASLIKNVISNLETHQVLYINTRTGQMLRTRSPI